MTGRTGGRLRRGVSATAVAAAAMVALTASQAPGLSLPPPSPTADDPALGADDAPATGGDAPYHTELPPLETPDMPDSSRELDDDGPVVTGPAEAGVPATVLAAYRRAESTLRSEQPRCNLSWQLLAAIGKVESGQARGGALDAEGTTLSPIRGPKLDGNGFADISDTDNGAYDGDTVHDRAVGPMQFIPSTWATWGADGNGDGARDPDNIFDAALAAGRYLCAADRDLADPADLERALLSYNPSREYLNTVLSWLEFYRKGVHEVPDGTGQLPDSPGPGNPKKPKPDPVTEEPEGRPASDRTSKEKDTDPPGKPEKPGKPEEPAGDEPGEGDETPRPRPPAVDDDHNVIVPPPGEDPDGEDPDGDGPAPDDGKDEEPEEPEEPTDPEEPEEPTDPEEPEEPTDPEDPEEPGEEPGECPVDPGEPEEPQEPQPGTEEPTDDEDAVDGEESEKPADSDASEDAEDAEGEDGDDPNGDDPNGDDPNGDDPDADDPDADDPADPCGDGEEPDGNEDGTPQDDGESGGEDGSAGDDTAARPEDAARVE
ncbi:lytic murein transglycosylase [Streptomyces chumphonensis]|uniref:lytic transglycosylase domain-containing protein n=1 Tax=Streptomyces chumphonensis TaxID=1214925 RepID=UPI003D71B796